jgi:hypothetical protein
MSESGLTTDEKRRLLIEEGVFTGVESADHDFVAMLWKARDTEEYEVRLGFRRPP